MALKLDISKAYDHIEWSYLEAILLEKGFNVRWVHLILQCVQSVSYNIVHARIEIGPIISSGDLQQGPFISVLIHLMCR